MYRYEVWYRPFQRGRRHVQIFKTHARGKASAWAMAIVNLGANIQIIAIWPAREILQKAVS